MYQIHVHPQIKGDSLVVFMHLFFVTFYVMKLIYLVLFCRKKCEETDTTIEDDAIDDEPIINLIR